VSALKPDAQQPPQSSPPTAPEGGEHKPG
jgi:hypothetical protein